MKRYGLIGYPLEHSFSKNYFDRKFKDENINNVSYELIPLPDISLFNELIKSGKYSGFNVTIPYKQSIIKYLDWIDDIAKEINAVNTIKIENSKLSGYNTDIDGFEKSFIKLLKPHHKKALILGTGGSSKAVGYILKKHNIDFLFVSRTPISISQISYIELTKKMLDDYNIIINCTPKGMYPLNNEYPDIPYNYITSEHLLFDLIYNPELTMFMKLGKERGAEIQNGLQMLYLQAEKAWEIWNM